MAVRAAIGGLIALALQGCAGGQVPSGSSAPQPTDNSLLGRWLLTMPNAPPCGLEFDGAPGRAAGKLRRMAGVRETSIRAGAGQWRAAPLPSQMNSMNLWLNSNLPGNNSKANP